MHQHFLRRILALLCLVALLTSSMPTLALARVFSTEAGSAFLGYLGSTGEVALGGFRLASDSGSIAYCLDSAASLPAGEDYTRRGAPSLPLSRIVAAGYPARESAFGISGDELRYATQVAIWQHLSQIRSVDVTRSQDGSFAESYERLRFAVDGLLAEAIGGGSMPATVSPAQCEAVMLGNGSLVAGPYSVHVEHGGPTYRVQVDESAPGCFPSDASGTPQTTFSIGEEFYLSLDPRTSQRSVEATVSLAATDVSVTEWGAPDAGLQDLLEVETTHSAIALTAQAVCAEIVIVKSAEDDAPVSGTRFRVRNAKTGYDAVHEITDGDRVRLLGLRGGTYTVEEVDVPSRYRMPPAQTVLLARGGSTRVDVRNELIRGSLSIVKRNALTGTPLHGASFVLEESPALGMWEVAGSGETDERGELEFGDLAAGRYRVQEVGAPQGYLLAQVEGAREFAIDEDGEVVAIEVLNEPIVLACTVEIDSQATAQTSGVIRHTISGVSNASNCDADGLALVTSVDPEIGRLSELFTGTWTGDLDNRYRIDILTTSGRSLVWAEDVPTDLPTRLEVSHLPLIPGERVSSFRFDFGPVARDFTESSPILTSMDIDAKPERSQIVWRAEVSVSRDDLSATATNDAVSALLSPPVVDLPTLPPVPDRQPDVLVVEGPVVGRAVNAGTIPLTGDAGIVPLSLLLLLSLSATSALLASRSRHSERS